MLIREMNEEDRIEKKKIGEKVKEIKDKDICPSCYNNEFGGLYENYNDKLLYENDILACFLEKYPRTAGHTIILIKEHYEDISEMPVEVGTEVMRVTGILVRTIKEVLGAEKVYMCTMCDDGRNHLHFQLIPRYDGDIIGSKMFVKNRRILVKDEELIGKIRENIKAQM